MKSRTKLIVAVVSDRGNTVSYIVCQVKRCYYLYVGDISSSGGGRQDGLGCGFHSAAVSPGVRREEDGG